MEAHAKTNYVTTKLYGTSTCGCNKNAIFSDRAIVTFPTVAVCRPQVKLAAAKHWQWVQKLGDGSAVDFITGTFRVYKFVSA